MKRLVIISVFATWSIQGCDAEAQFLTWARERLHPAASTEQLEAVRRQLKMGTNSCPASADLWYYKSLVEQKLKLTDRDAKYTQLMLKDKRPSAQAMGFNPLESVATEPAPRKGPVQQKFALVIGIQQFQDKNVPALNFTGNDARKLASWLTGPSGRFPEENVTLLVDGYATTARIREALGDIRAKAQPDDLVLLYVSTHGLPGAEDPTGVSFVVTHDTNLSSDGKKFATSLPMVELRDFSRMVRARRFVLMLDTCFAGGAVGSRAIKPIGQQPIHGFTAALEGLQTGFGQAVITASRSTERSWESPKLQHGYFTYYLLQALQQDGGLSNLGAVYKALQQSVKSAVEKDFNGAQQNPIFDFSGGGDEIVLGVAPAATAATGD